MNSAGRHATRSQKVTGGAGVQMRLHHATSTTASPPVRSKRHQGNVGYGHGVASAYRSALLPRGRWQRYSSAHAVAQHRQATPCGSRHALEGTPKRMAVARHGSYSQSVGASAQGCYANRQRFCPSSSSSMGRYGMPRWGVASNMAGIMPPDGASAMVVVAGRWRSRGVLCARATGVWPARRWSAPFQSPRSPPASAYHRWRPPSSARCGRWQQLTVTVLGVARGRHSEGWGVLVVTRW